MRATPEAHKVAISQGSIWPYYNTRAATRTRKRRKKEATASSSSLSFSGLATLLPPMPIITGLLFFGDGEVMDLLGFLFDRHIDLEGGWVPFGDLPFGLRTDANKIANPIDQGE